MKLATNPAIKNASGLNPVLNIVTDPLLPTLESTFLLVEPIDTVPGDPSGLAYFEISAAYCTL